MKVYWFYYKPILWINLSISLVLSLIDIAFFPIIFATIGFGLSTFFASFFSKDSSFLFYNLGYSKFRLIGGSFFINIIFALALWPIRLI
ncbi:MAG TPA: hypothetical protein PKA53_08080 [Sphingobacterium sp.]|nr:hypothetical protein [Sphingobacterium sp.]